MRAVFQVAKYTFHEAVRRRFMNVILLFAFVVIAGAAIFSRWSPGAEFRMIVDTGLGSMRIFGLLMAVFLGALLIPTEIDKKTVHVLLAKPVTRMQFLLGKFAGAYFTVFVNVLFMGLAMLAVIAVRHRSFTGQEEVELLKAAGTLYPNLIYAVVLIMVEMLVLTAIAVTVSTVSGWIFTVVLSMSIYIAAQLRSTLGHLADPSHYASPVGRALLGGLYVVLPHFEDFDVREAIFLGDPVVASYVAKSAGLALLYVAVVLALGYIFFNEREV